MFNILFASLIQPWRQPMFLWRHLRILRNVMSSIWRCAKLYGWHIRWKP